jgi:hypothetical protein
MNNILILWLDEEGKSHGVTINEFEGLGEEIFKHLLSIACCFPSRRSNISVTPEKPDFQNSLTERRKKEINHFSDIHEQSRSVSFTNSGHTQSQLIVL